MPEELCDRGPYRFVRHPLYLSYLVAVLAAFIAMPHGITGLMLVAHTTIWILAARDDERRIAQSPLAESYDAYRRRAGMFLPRWSDATK